LAGVIKINFQKFMLYNIVGALAWISSLTAAGFYLGKFEWVQNNIEYIVIFLIIITMIPIINVYKKEKSNG
jgi:membrane-associated protein